jgi:hypothetical protein
MNPWLIIGVLVALGSFYGYGHHKGWVERDAEMQSEIAQKNEEARAKEQELTKQLNDNSTKLQEANNAISEKQTSLDRAIRAGSLRLKTTSCVQTSSSPTPANGNSNQEGSESERQTLAAIAEIIAQGDRNTAQLNACISAYEAVRSQVNGK